MDEYYNFDMNELKQEVGQVLSKESDKISSEKDDKLKEIGNNFKRIMGLA